MPYNYMGRDNVDYRRNMLYWIGLTFFLSCPLHRSYRMVGDWPGWAIEIFAGAPTILRQTWFAGQRDVKGVNDWLG